MSEMKKRKEAEIRMKPSIRATIRSLKAGQMTVFRVPHFKIHSVRTAVSQLNRAGDGKHFTCTEKGYPDGIEVRRVK